MYGVIPSSQNEQVYIFTGDSQGTTGTNCWHNWTKPQGISFIKILAIGAGGGGGGGLINASIGRNGPGGGGSGAVTSAIIPASLVDDSLFILCGIGGAGGTGSATPSNGGNGTTSYVSYKIPSIARQYVIVTASGGVGGAAGLSGALQVGASGGAGGGATTLGNSIWALPGTFKSFAGQNGGNGAGISPTVVNGDSITPLLNSIVSPGAGGSSMNTAGTSFPEGTILANGILPAIPSSRDGVWFWNPMCGTGGSGAPNGGNGGNATYGSGGGAGGSGSSGTGNGGRGGDGLVIITCW